MDFIYKIISFFMSMAFLTTSFFGYGDTYSNIKKNNGFSEKRLTKISEDIEKRVANQDISGASVLVMQNGKIVYSDTVGYANYETKELLKEDSMFRLASMSKPITAVAVMIQVERGLLGLDDPVSKYIPEFAFMKIAVTDDNGNIISSRNAENEISIRDLLTHSSGLVSGKVIKAHSHYLAVEGKTLAQVIPTLGDSYLEFDPGTDYQYSPIFAFDTLGYLVELTSGLPYDVFLKENIFIPLEMKDITFNPTPEQESRVVKTHASKDGKLSLVNITAKEYSYIGGYPTTYFGGGAGLIGTISDYCNFAQMLLNKGEFKGKRILSEETVKMMSTPQSDAPTNKRWGLGMRVTIKNNSTVTKGSYGWSGAYGTHFWIDPANDLLAIYMMNMTTIGGADSDTGNEFEKNVMDAYILRNTYLK